MRYFADLMLCLSAGLVFLFAMTDIAYLPLERPATSSGVWLIIVAAGLAVAGAGIVLLSRMR